MALMPAFHPKSDYEGLSLCQRIPRLGVHRTGQDTGARNSLPPVLGCLGKCPALSPRWWISSEVRPALPPSVPSAIRYPHPGD